MANYLVTDTELTNIANAIRSKTGGSSPLLYPTGFISAINGISTGTSAVLQSKTNITPTESSQTIEPDSGYNGLSSVQINGISSSYVGTGIARKSSGDLTSSNLTVTAPAGYYASAATKTLTDANLVAGNIKSGTSIFGVTGTYVTPHDYPTYTINFSSGTTISSVTCDMTYAQCASCTTGNGGSIWYAVVLYGSSGQKLSGSIYHDNSVANSPVYCYVETTTEGIATYKFTYTSDGTITWEENPVELINCPKFTNNNGTIACNKTFAECATLANNGTLVAVVYDNSAWQPIMVDDVTENAIIYKVIIIASGYGISIGTLTYSSSGTITIDGTLISERSSSDLTTSGATVTAPAGYYPSNATKTLTDSNLVAGNIKSGVSIFGVTGNYAGGSVSLQAKTGITPTESSQTISADSGYDGLSSVQINAISSTYVGSGITSRNSSSLSATGAVVTAPSGYYASDATLTISDAVLGNIELVYNASKDTLRISVPLTTAGYLSAGIGGSVATITGLNVINSDITITPTESQQTAATYGDFCRNGQIIVSAISPTYVGSGITSRSSTDLSASGATVTVPAGYYSTQATKSVSSLTLPTSTSSSATSGYTSKATISRSTSDQYINIPTGYNSAGSYYKISAVANGSATGPSSLSGSSATVSTGTNTLTLTKTGVTTTPTVSAGYVSSATTSTATVTLTASVTTKAAATITPGTTNQTIASGTYLTGTQTISGDSNLVASNIISGKTIFGVSGSVVIQHYYTGSSTPSSSTGVNGDIYLKTS